MSSIHQNNVENTIDTTSRIYISLINHLTDIGVYFKSHTLKLLDADKYLSSNKCTICSEEYEDYNPIRMLNCRHIFHLKCIEKYLEEKKECADCKHSVINWFDYSSMLVYISSLMLQCCQPDCFYFATQNSINEAKASIASIANSFPDDETAYENCDTSIAITAENEEYYLFLENHLLQEYKGKKQQLLIKLFANIKKINNHTEKSLFSGITKIEKQSALSDKDFLKADSCPYPENILKNKKPDNFFSANYPIICDYIINIIRFHLPLDCNIKSINYALLEQKISLSVIINTMPITGYFNAEGKITSGSNTARKCLYVLHMQCNNFVKLCKIIYQYPGLVKMQNILYLKETDIHYGKLIFSYYEKIIGIDFHEFSPNVNDFTINFSRFTYILERNGIDPKYLTE